MKLFFFVFGFLLGPHFSMAQSEERIPQSYSSTSAWDSPWQVRVYTDYPDYRFLIATGEGRESLEASNQRLQFNPANHPEIGFSISRGLFYLGYKTALPVKNQGYADYNIGKTDVKDFDFGVQWDYFKVGAYYTRFKGFFVDFNATHGITVEKEEGSTSVVSSIGDSNHTPDIWNRPDVKTMTYGVFGQIQLPFSGKNSFLSKVEELDTFNQIWEMTFSLRGGYHRLAIEGDYAFVPENRAEVFPEISDLTGIYQQAFYAQLGWLNQFNLTKKWNIQLEVGGGGEVMSHYSRYQIKENERDFRTGQRIDMLLGFGYQGEFNQWNLSYQSFFRIMNGESSSSLDTQYSRFGINYVHVF